jgi:hypothetical protein
LEGILQRLKKINRTPEKTIQNLMRIKLGYILLESGAVTMDQLEQAMAEQQSHSDIKFGQCLLGLGFIKERDLTVALSRQYGLPVINVNSQRIDPGVLRRIPAAILRNSKFVPLEYDEVNNTLLLVTCDPGDVATIINLRSLLNCEVSIYLSDESVVMERIRQFCQLTEEANLHVEEIAFSRYSGDLKQLASLLVDRAQDLDARSLSLRYFNHLIWVRYVVEDAHLNLVVNTTSA